VVGALDIGGSFLPKAHHHLKMGRQFARTPIIIQMLTRLGER
jgi:hypothetical protein